MNRTILSLFALSTVCGCGYFVSTTGAKVPLRTRAPSFELTDQAGRAVSLEGLLKKGPVVVEFYRGAFCSLARGRLGTLQEQTLAGLREQGVSLVAISTDDPATVRRMAEDNNLRFPLLSDPDAKTVGAYGVMMDGDHDGRKIAVPATFVIARDGTVTWAHVGDTAGDFSEPHALAKAVSEARRTTATARSRGTRFGG